MVKNWEHFLFPYEQAVGELKIKLRGIRKEFLQFGKRSPVEFVTGRVKPVSSIKEKMNRRYISEDRLSQDMEDIAGLRIMCPFVEDIYQVVDILRKRTDINILEERDYVNKEKSSGYRSYHIVFEYPVEMSTGEHKILSEIQVRTLAMNFWATVEHSLNYKYNGVFPEELKKRLQESAETAFKLDEGMSEIRDELIEKQSENHKNNRDD
ncbi:MULTISPECIES: GTP pyrophosphokinase [Apilactobacillus]|uniref:GTP pyrophosphokinase family protein n=2 Tax=Apilactobacillus TaxID=2767877 RepID=A0A2S2JJL5_9LACO|nr:MULTISPECIES: GTP pyrophosphokinase family protein [Apilactobacillus]TPR13747.1 GTP pyrophosphokinase family protein [Apilactobacillus timberlakei]TPR15062.1 GTP pyrophosphokinase family protein [Apilactobacillus timberlakei]TPR16954.1 GTP pyrophosphokinase family protein [Apilactobacillus timberlakei]TPR19882.1 GTP pyrophosphokinase family protein [Apilactobacillus timberlakei]TPR21599.1 GTP pyrophosphokinase family protein [Apilactobacillus timberlakei]